MSFLTGKQVTTGPQDAMGLRGGLIDFLSKSGFDTAITGLPRGGDLSPFMKLFHDQLSPVLAQAKESAGNLTGSSLGDIIGATAGRSTSDFLLNLLNQRAQRFGSLLSGVTTGGFGEGHKPGFLDYLFKGAAAAAKFFPGGGGGPEINTGVSATGGGGGPSSPGPWETFAAP